jgi:hypothetical protein
MMLTSTGAGVGVGLGVGVGVGLGDAVGVAVGVGAGVETAGVGVGVAVGPNIPQPASAAHRAIIATTLSFFIDRHLLMPPCEAGASFSFLYVRIRTFISGYRDIIPEETPFRYIQISPDAI